MQATRGSIMPLAAEKRGANAAIPVGKAVVRLDFGMTRNDANWCWILIMDLIQ